MNKALSYTGAGMIGAVVLTTLLPWWVLVGGGGGLVYVASKVKENR